VTDTPDTGGRSRRPRLRGDADRTPLERRGERGAPGDRTRSAASDDRDPSGCRRVRVRVVPGGRQIDCPKLRAHLGVKRLSLPDAGEAKAATGHERGRITPFGATNDWPVIADAAVRHFDTVAIGAPDEARRGHRRRRPPRPSATYAVSRLRGRKRPCPGAPRNPPFYRTWPRCITSSGRPCTTRPSYAE
jgi:hypothetical protein